MVTPFLLYHANDQSDIGNGNDHNREYDIHCVVVRGLTWIVGQVAWNGTQDLAEKEIHYRISVKKRIYRLEVPSILARVQGDGGEVEETRI